VQQHQKNLQKTLKNIKSAKNAQIFKDSTNSSNNIKKASTSFKKAQTLKNSTICPTTPKKLQKRSTSQAHVFHSHSPHTCLFSLTSTHKGQHRFLLSNYLFSASLTPNITI